MKPKLFIIAFITMLSVVASAQKVKIKKEKVLVDGKEFLDIKKIDMNTIVLMPVGTKDEIIQLSRHNGETRDISSDYVKMFFIKNDLKLESQSIGRRNWEYYIEWMIENDLFDENGNLDTARVPSIVSRYDENVSEKMSR